MPQKNNTSSTKDQNTEAQKNDKQTNLFERDEFGLVKSKKYFFGDDGLVDWRKMINPKFLVPINSRIQDSTDLKSVKVEDLDDSQLLILLGGIKDLAHTRGFTRVKYKVINSSPSYVSVSCRIYWMPNFETSFKEVSFESLADAHIDNTKSFAKDFLMATAENRAFVRSVRNFLRINILGSDEIGDSVKNQSQILDSAESAVSASHPINVLKETMSKAGVSFETIKATMTKEGEEGAENWNQLSDIPNKIIFSLIQRLKKKIGRTN